MERKNIIVVVAALAVIGVAVWALWPSSAPPVSPPPTIGTASTLPTPSSTSSASPSSTPAPVESPSHSTEVVEDDGTMTPERAAMLAAATDYLTTLYTLDYSLPNPGFDYERLMTLSSGDLLLAHQNRVPLWQNPSGSDVRQTKEMNSKSPGGVYKQSVSIDGAWLTPSQSMVVSDISTTNSLQYNEMVEESFIMQVEKCTTNTHGWCVTSVEQTPQE